ncbi:MAG: restriction endonuclease subunit S, partial [Treponema sp.]|nr:restriction endonuclease subunit S [Treponema sp.]
VNPTLLGSFAFPIISSTEQHRIVAKIDVLFSKLDKGIETLQTIRQQLCTYRQAVLKWAFEGKKWEMKPLDSLGDLGRGKSKHRPRNDVRLFERGKYPFIQTGEVKAANGKIKKVSAMYNDFGLQQSKLWPIGTLCITIAANIADTAFLEIEACFPDSVVGFIANEDVVLPKYVDFFIQSAKQMLWYYAPATAQKNINLTTLENLMIPYCSREEQMAIVAIIESRLSVCDKLETIVDETLAKSEALRQSILKKAFEGRLVPQNPTDEPADKLLERIRAERQKEEAKSKPVRRKKNAR